MVRDADGLPELKFTPTGQDFVTSVDLPNFKSKKNLVIGASAGFLCLSNGLANAVFYFISEKSLGPC